MADFGLSQAIDGVRSRSGSTLRQGPRGTLRWMAPECLDGDSPTKASDIYSLGITIWEVRDSMDYTCSTRTSAVLSDFLQAYSEEVPFSRYVDRILPRRVIEKQERPPRPQRMEENAIWEIVQRCWMPESSSRPTISLVQRSLQPLTTRLGPGEHTAPSAPTLDANWVIHSFEPSSILTFGNARQHRSSNCICLSPGTKMGPIIAFANTILEAWQSKYLH